MDYKTIFTSDKSLLRYIETRQCGLSVIMNISDQRHADSTFKVNAFQLI